jgi:hypothetical protein
MVNLIDPSWIKFHDYPKDYLPAGCIAIDHTSEEGTVKGFIDPKNGVCYIQDVEIKR